MPNWQTDSSNVKSFVDLARGKRLWRPFWILVLVGFLIGLTVRYESVLVSNFWTKNSVASILAESASAHAAVNSYRFRAINLVSTRGNQDVYPSGNRVFDPDHRIRSYKVEAGIRTSAGRKITRGATGHEGPGSGSLCMKDPRIAGLGFSPTPARVGRTGCFEGSPEFFAQIDYRNFVYGSGAGGWIDKGDRITVPAAAHRQSSIYEALGVLNKRSDDVKSINVRRQQLLGADVHLIEIYLERGRGEGGGWTDASFEIGAQDHLIRRIFWRTGPGTHCGRFTCPDVSDYPSSAETLLELFDYRDGPSADGQALDEDFWRELADGSVAGLTPVSGPESIGFRPAAGDAGATARDAGSMPAAAGPLGHFFWQLDSAVITDVDLHGDTVAFLADGAESESFGQLTVLCL